jgi:hypothetical protein
VALPRENVQATSSPTPMRVRARFAGWVATVCEVIVHVTHGAAGPGGGVGELPGSDGESHSPI